MNSLQLFLQTRIYQPTQFYKRHVYMHLQVKINNIHLMSPVYPLAITLFTYKLLVSCRPFATQDFVYCTYIVVLLSSLGDRYFFNP